MAVDDGGGGGEVVMVTAVVVVALVLVVDVSELLKYTQGLRQKKYFLM